LRCPLNIFRNPNTQLEAVAKADPAERIPGLRRSLEINDNRRWIPRATAPAQQALPAVELRVRVPGACRPLQRQNAEPFAQICAPVPRAGAVEGGVAPAPVLRPGFRVASGRRTKAAKFVLQKVQLLGECRCFLPLALKTPVKGTMPIFESPHAQKER
jgi:hypothetical protein